MIRILFVICFLFIGKYVIAQEIIERSDISKKDTVILFAANKSYKGSSFKEFLFGEHYRKEWATPVKAPIFDFKNSGLKVIKQGGSRQTINLRLEDSIGRQYVLRSIDKTPKKALPEDLRNTFLADILQDQTSTAHPYGAFTIPIMANAIGVHHTNPFLVYVPHDPALGEFNEVLANQPALFEERPDGPMENVSSMGNPSNVFGSDKMMEKLFKDNDNFVDEKLFAKSRLFDMLIGDWSRHEDQWRWAEFKFENEKLFKPIPRDRDHAYFKFDGLLPSIASAPWGMRHLNNFGYKLNNLKGLGNSARQIDRLILTSLTEKDWIAIADSIKILLTDNIIDSAIRQMPENVFPISGPELISKLKCRRDQLPSVAKKYYKILAKQVNVYGSDKHELFQVDRLSSETTHVKVYKINKKGDIIKLIYDRVFFDKETNEIRLFGLDGNDKFHLTGKVKKGIKVIIVAGEGDDFISDSSYVQKGSKKTIVFDDTKNMDNILLSKETLDKRSEKLKDSVNIWNYNFNYNYAGPYLFPEFNMDDGLFLGAGFIKRTYEFKKFPYANLHKIGFNYASNTNAFNFKYYGDFHNVFKKWNLSFAANFLGPKYVLNYFGFGNESRQIVDDIDYYRVRAREINLSPVLYRNISPKLFFGMGLIYQYMNVRRTPNRYIAQQEEGVNIESDALKANHFSGLRVNLKGLYVNNLVFPTTGNTWNLEVQGLQQFNSSILFSRIQGEFSIFRTPSNFLRFITFASRIGGATNIGKFYFFQGNTLGGTTNLRGYRRTRFYGRTALFQNNEIRFKVVNVKTYLMPFKMGAMAFFDHGRVWADNEASSLWHVGYGPGIWFGFFDKFILTGTYGITQEGNMVNVQVGFLF